MKAGGYWCVYWGMRTALLLVLVLVGCSDTTAPKPEAELDCVPPGPEADWCHHLDNDVAVDSLIPFPPGYDPHSTDSPSH